MDSAGLTQPPGKVMNSAKAYGLLAALGGVALLVEALFFAAFLVLAFLLGSLSDAPRKGDDAALSRGWVIMLVMSGTGFLSLVWGIRMTSRKTFGVVGLVICLILTGAVLSVAVVPIDVVRLVNATVGMGMLACALWWAGEDGTRGWANSFAKVGVVRDEIRSMLRTSRDWRRTLITRSRERRLARMVESLKGGRDRRRTGLDAESWD